MYTYEPAWIGEGLGYAVMRLTDLGDSPIGRWVAQERIGPTYATAWEAEDEAERLNREEAERLSRVV